MTEAPNQPSEVASLARRSLNRNVRQEMICRMRLGITSGASPRLECRSGRVPAPLEIRQGFSNPQRMICARVVAHASPGPFASYPFPCGASQMCSCSLPCWSFLGSPSIGKRGADVR